MSLELRMKLLTILPRILQLGLKRFDILKEFPEARGRSMLLTLYDDRGGRISFYMDTSGTVREVDPRKAPPATTEVSMHIDVFIKILKGKLDFRTAYLYDLVDIKSNDGLPASYHFLLWAAFFDKAVEVLGK